MMLHIWLCSLKFARRWVPKLSGETALPSIPSFTPLLVPILVRYASLHFNLFDSPGLTLSFQVESAQTIWDLLQGSKLAHLHEEETNLVDDKYSLRQDRYPLRTAPQFLGPQLEDILAAHATVTLECNTSEYGCQSL